MRLRTVDVRFFRIKARGVKKAALPVGKRALVSDPANIKSPADARG